MAALLAGGANPNEKDKYGETHPGQHRDCVPGIVTVLYWVTSSSVAGAVACTWVGPGNTALHAACEENREAVAVMLLENGARTNVRNTEGKRPLELARTGLRATLTSLGKK